MDEMSAPPAASATTPALATSAPAMTVTTSAPATAAGTDSTSAPLIDTSLAKGTAQSAEAPAAKKRKMAAPAVMSNAISDK